MKWLASVLGMLTPANAAWQSIYSSDFSVAYLKSSNGSLFTLPISNLPSSQSAVASVDVARSLKQIASSPANSSLVVDSDGHLLAIWGSSGCAASPIEVSQYDAQSDQWSTLGQSHQNWFQSGMSVFLSKDTDSVYMYGGECNGVPQSGFYKYDFNSSTFASVESVDGITPQSMSGAATLALDDYQTLVVGGKAKLNTWISMQQIALFGHGSWAFSPVSNSTGVDSRENAVLLPLFSLGEDGNSTQVKQLMVVGGTVDGRSSEPEVVLLQHSDEQGWYWTPMDFDLSNADIILSLYGTLVTIDSKRNVVLYGKSAQQQQWTTVTSVSVPKRETTNLKKGTSTAVVAVVSTLLPVIAVCLLAAGGWWWFRRHREHALLLKSRSGMLNRQNSVATSVRSWSNWVPSKHRPTESGSIMMLGSDDGDKLVLSKQRRNLRVVNPDYDAEGRSTSNSEKRSSSGASRRENPFED